MGKKGVHISIFVVTVSAVMIFTSYFLVWQHLSTALSVIQAHISLMSISITTVVPKYKIPPSDLRQARDAACSTNQWAVFGEVCASLTRDYVCGIVYILLSLIAIVLDGVAIGYLGYYVTGNAHRSYRKAAFNCLVAAPVCHGVGLLIYIIAIVTGTRGWGGGWSALSNVVQSPGMGLFAAIVGGMCMCVVPFLSKTWALPTNEALTEERRVLKKEHMDQVLYNTRLQSDSSSGVMRPSQYEAPNPNYIVAEPAPGGNPPPHHETPMYQQAYPVMPTPPQQMPLSPPQHRVSAAAPNYTSTQRTTVSYHQTAGDLPHSQNTLVYEQQPPNYANAAVVESMHSNGMPSHGMPSHGMVPQYAHPHQNSPRANAAVYRVN